MGGCVCVGGLTIYMPISTEGSGMPSTRPKFSGQEEERMKGTI